MSHIAYLGTGLLGSAFVEAALGRGDQVAVWNRSLDKAQALERFGATVGTTPAAAVQGAARVHLVLRDDASVEEVIAAARPGLAAATIVIDHTTTAPAPTAERTARLNAAGVRYLHCPVFIGPAGARLGKGTILSSGPRALFDAVAPALGRQAERVRFLGERADLAAVHKLAGNAFNLGITALIADALAVGTGARVDSAELLETLAEFNSANNVRGRGRAMVERRFDAGFELAMARKDMQLILDTAGAGALAMLPGFAARMDAFLAEGRAHDDFSVVGRDSVHPG